MKPLLNLILRVILSVVFVVLISPVALLLRICGFDPLRLRHRRSENSYWQLRDRVATKFTELR